jgi:phosphoribosylformylglycinamidine synthase
MVQTNTVQGPGGEAGVIRIKDTGIPGHERGLAMALDGNGRWCYLDPKLGAMHAVAEAARKVACTGATPVAATNCLNFGNPEKPEIMAQLSAAIDGIAEACTALGTPITGGNVSLYNETRGEGIYPTPVLGVVGILDDVTKAVPADFQCEGDAILLIWSVPDAEQPNPNLNVPFVQEPINHNIVGHPEPIVKEGTDATEAAARAEFAVFGSSEFAKVILNSTWGHPPKLALEAEADLHRLLGDLANLNLVRSARDISDGGLAVALAQAAFPYDIGAVVAQEPALMASPLFGLFSEPASTILLSADPHRVSQIQELAEEQGFFAARIGTTGGDRLEITVYGDTFISTPLTELRKSWSTSLESAIHEEVTA